MHITYWGLNLLDLGAIAAYFVLVFIISLRAARRIRNQEDYFMAGRRFGKLIQTFAAFGQATSIENATATTTLVNANGAAGIWASLAGGLANVPIFWMTAVWYRRMRVLTLGDFFEERFDSRRMASFYAVCQAIFLIFIAAIGLTAMSKTVAAITPKPAAEYTSSERAEHSLALEREKLESADYSLLSQDQQTRLAQLQSRAPRKEVSELNEYALIAIVGVITLLYASIGGLAAAFLVDLVQGVFIILLTVLLIPFAIARINLIHGGSGFAAAFETMHRVLPSSMFELWGSPSLVELTWYWIATFSLMFVINVAVQANQLTACGSAKDDYTARYGFVSGILLKRYVNLLWGVVALLTLVLYGGTVSDPDYVWGHATRDLLGPLGIGLVGLMIACMMAALMASKSAMMLTASALLTQNFYKPLVPGKSESHYILVGRLFNVVFMGAAVVTATKFHDIFGLLKILVMFNCIVAASFWLGVLWRRANRIGAWSSMLITFVATVLLPFGLPVLESVRASEYLQMTTPPVPVTRSYIARQMDVEERERAIRQWEQRPPASPGQAQTPPAPLALGAAFEKTILLPAKSVFWSEGLRSENGATSGKGYLKVELILLHRLGMNLTNNSYALNETLAMLFRIVLPIAVLMLVSVATARDPAERLDQFYGKMRTPVEGTPEDDRQAMALTRAHPRRFDDLRLFPNSEWEFRKWNRVDWIGVLGSGAVTAGVVLALLLLVNFGS